MTSVDLPNPPSWVRSEDRGAGLRILIIDDAPIVTRGYTEEILKRWPEAKVETEWRYEQAKTRIDEFDPHIILLDLELRNGDPSLGHSLHARIRERDMSLPVVIVTHHAETHHIRQSLELGARGYWYTNELGLTWDVGRALEAVLRGEESFTPGIARRVTELRVDPQWAPLVWWGDTFEWEKLSEREREVARLVKAGKTGKEIAKELGITEHTVYNHKTKISEKFGLVHRHTLDNYLRNQDSAPS